MRPIPPRRQLIRTTFSVLIIAILIVPLLLLATEGALAETHVFGGTVRSQVHITQRTTIQATNIASSQITNGSKFIYNATYPSSSYANGYSAAYSNVQIGVSPSASRVSGIMTDQYGNQYKQYEWDSDKITSPSFNIVVTTQFDADITGDMSPVSYDDPIGTSAYQEYQSPTAMVQSDAPAIVSKKNDLLSGATSEADAVDRIMNFVRTNIPNPSSNVQKDALFSLTSNSGNCVNRAHLALALLRSAGIPARCVSGLVYGDKYTISYDIGDAMYTTDISWGSESHVWVEVYYPQEGAWVAYDPWMDKGFVDSRHVKLGISKDYNKATTSTSGDLDILYVSLPGSQAPTISPLSTSISSSSLQDSISLNYRYSRDSPPSGIFMMARELQSSSAPTPVPSVSTTPGNATPTPLPGNVSLTPTPKPGGTHASPTAGQGGNALGTDSMKYNVTGSIVDASTGMPVGGATVMLDTIELSANQAGKFTFLYAVGNDSYTLSASAPGYETDRQNIVPNNGDTDLTIRLKPLASSATPSASKRTPAPGALAAAVALAAGALFRRKKVP